MFARESDRAFTVDQSRHVGCIRGRHLPNRARCCHGAFSRKGTCRERGVSPGFAAEGNMVEAAGRLFHSLPEWAGLCLHPEDGMRSVLWMSPSPNPLPDRRGSKKRIDNHPSAGSSDCADQPVYESLQGRPDVGRLPTPRRCPVATTATSGFTDVSSVFTLLSRAGATFDRTRVRKPYASRHYVRSPVIVLVARYPTGREDVRPAQERFNGSALKHTETAIL